MRRAFCLLLIGLVGCNGVTPFHLTTVQLTPTFFTVSGFVIFVQLTFVPVNGIFVDDHRDLVQGATFSTVTFCGELVGEFLLHAFTQVDFLSGTPCATVVDILVDDPIGAPK
jgi:hypothetical protein